MEEVSENVVSAPVKPIGGVIVRLACKLGSLYAFGKRGIPQKVKQALETMDPVPFSKIGGSQVPGFKTLRFSGVRVPAHGSVNFLITINDETRPEFSFQFMLQPAVVVELSFDGSVIKSEILGKLEKLVVIKPGKIVPITHKKPSECLREKGPAPILFTKKHQPVGERHSPHHSLTLFNDGKYLFSKEDETLNQLFFQMYYKEVPANEVPGASFLESTVLFRTFGHTLDGSVVIMLREKWNNWSLTIAVGKGQAFSFNDHHNGMSAVKL
jgi:hypothetical protein